MNAQVQAAAKKLAEGEVVAFPTETVYGLGADAENITAVQKIYQLKGRPSNHPVIVHIASDADIMYWVSSLPEEAKRLMKHFWPGPLTLILPRALHIPEAVSGGQKSIGIRCPSHPMAQALLRAFSALKPNGQGGIAAPSANKFGHVSPTMASHVAQEFSEELSQGLLSLVEGDASTIGIESTIVDVSRAHEGLGAVLLRPGHITRQQLAEVLGYMPSYQDAKAPRVSGSLKAHYAPHTPLSRLTEQQCMDLVVPSDEKWVLLAFDNMIKNLPSRENLCLYPVSSDPQHYARDIYAILRQVDAQAYQRICVQALPEDESWEALNDRLQRAAAAFEA